MRWISMLGAKILAFNGEAVAGVGAGGKFAAALEGITAPIGAIVAGIGVAIAAFVSL